MGYVHDVAMKQFIPPTSMHAVTGTWSYAAGAVAGTIVYKKAAAAETSTINVPILVPHNGAALKGSMVASVEIDYEISTLAATSITLSMNKVTRGADGADATVAAVTGTQTLTPGTTAASVDEHRDKFTITTPVFLTGEDYLLLKIAAVCAATTVLEILGATVNYTYRV